MLKRTAILKLQTEHGLATGHNECARYLEKCVEELLSHPATLDSAAQNILLNEVTEVFTEDDNNKLLARQTKN